jgi:hypothetical protein
MIELQLKLTIKTNIFKNENNINQRPSRTLSILGSGVLLAS